MSWTLAGRVTFTPGVSGATLSVLDMGTLNPVAADIAVSGTTFATFSFSIADGTAVYVLCTFGGSAQPLVRGPFLATPVSGVSFTAISGYSAPAHDEVDFSEPGSDIPAYARLTHVQNRRLTDKLLSNLYGSFDIDPVPAESLLVTYAGTFTMSVVDWTLTTVVVGDSAANLSLDLSLYTLSELVTAINAAPGYQAYLLRSDMADITAMTLFAQTAIPAPNIYSTAQSYTSLTWAYVDTFAYQIYLLEQAIAAAVPAEIRLDLADGEFLDFWLDFILNQIRSTGQADSQVRSIITSTILGIKSNNLAIEQIVHDQTGIDVQVLDIPWFNPTTLTVDPAVVSEFSLTLLTSGPNAGWPAWGDPVNENVLQAAFAVIFSADTPSDAIVSVMTVANRNRSGGTYGIAYGEVGVIETYPGGQGFLNSQLWTTAPAPGYGRISDFAYGAPEMMLTYPDGAGITNSAFWLSSPPA